MTELTVEDILELHTKGIQRWGGEPTLKPDTIGRVDGALQAALYASAQNESGEPDALAYASGVLTYLGRAQHFVDGNKRAAWGGCVRALEVNGFTIRATTDEIIAFIEKMVVEQRGIQAVADQLGLWLEVVE